MKDYMKSNPGKPQNNTFDRCIFYKSKAGNPKHASVTHAYKSDTDPGTGGGSLLASSTNGYVASVFNMRITIDLVTKVGIFVFVFTRPSSVRGGFFVLIFSHT